MSASKQALTELFARRPTGLGVATRLVQRKHKDWLLIDMARAFSPSFVTHARALPFASAVG